MKILVTGAYGQLGNELKDLTDRFSGWSFLFTDADSLDITHEEEVNAFVEKEKPGFVINCAAYTAVDKAETEKDQAFEVNALAPSFLAQASRKVNAGFIHISTDYVFDGQACNPYSETDRENPQTIYGKTKREGELLCLAQNPATLIIRTSWLYSAYGSNFVKTMLRLGRERHVLKVVFDQVGTPTYAGDLAKAVLSLVSVFEKKSGKFVPGIYHYSNEGVASWYDFAIAVFEFSGLTCNVVPVLSEAFPTPARRPYFSVLNKEKIKQTYHLDIPYWKDSLRVCLEKLNLKNYKIYANE